jgi:hypothetical protein
LPETFHFSVFFFLFCFFMVILNNYWIAQLTMWYFLRLTQI